MHVTLEAMCTSVTKPAVIHVSPRPHRVSSRHCNSIWAPCSKPASVARHKPSKSFFLCTPSSGSLRSRQHAEIAPDLHATAAEKRGPFDRVAAAALTNFTCHGNLGVKIVSQNLIRTGRENGKAERMELTYWSWALSEQEQRKFSTVYHDEHCVVWTLSYLNVSLKWHHCQRKCGYLKCQFFPHQGFPFTLRLLQWRYRQLVFGKAWGLYWK